MEIGKPFGPPSRSLWVEEVRESSVDSPYLTDEHFTFLILDKDILCDSIFVGFVLFTILLRVFSDGDTGIDDWDIMHVLIVEIINEISESFKGTLLVIGEITVVFHVIDV
jgi:hypothetical protein